MRISDWSSDVCSSDLPAASSTTIWCCVAVSGWSSSGSTGSPTLSRPTNLQFLRAQPAVLERRTGSSCALNRHLLCDTDRPRNPDERLPAPALATHDRIDDAAQPGRDGLDAHRPREWKTTRRN